MIQVIEWDATSIFIDERSAGLFADIFMGLPGSVEDKTAPNRNSYDYFDEWRTARNVYAAGVWSNQHRLKLWLEQTKADSIIGDRLDSPYVCNLVNGGMVFSRSRYGKWRVYFPKGSVTEAGWILERVPESAIPSTRVIPIKPFSFERVMKLIKAAKGDPQNDHKKSRVLTAFRNCNKGDLLFFKDHYYG